MEDLKRLIFPAVAALILHGFFISLKLPKQEPLNPALSGNPIKIAINTISPPAPPAPPAILPQKKAELKRTEITPKAIPPKKVEQKKDDNKTPPKELFDKAIVAQAKAAAITEHTENIENKLRDVQPREKKSLAPIHQKAIPMYRQNKQPAYPLMAKRRGYEGITLLNVLVDAAGMVSEIKIKTSSGHLSLDSAALETVKNWLFTPATEDGRPVAMWVDVPIEFQLK
jgi:protein TonB